MPEYFSGSKPFLARTSLPLSTFYLCLFGSRLVVRFCTSPSTFAFLFFYVLLVPSEFEHEPSLIAGSSCLRFWVALSSSSFPPFATSKFLCFDSQTLYYQVLACISLFLFFRVLRTDSEDFVLAGTSTESSVFPWPFLLYHSPSFRKNASYLISLATFSGPCYSHRFWTLVLLFGRASFLSVWVPASSIKLAH